MFNSHINLRAIYGVYYHRILSIETLLATKDPVQGRINDNE